MTPLGRIVFAAFSTSAIAAACSCYQPPTLCSRLNPDMVAFVGSPISTLASGRWREHTTFQIDERLWGLPSQAGTISIEHDRSLLRGRQTVFVLAERRPADGAYFLDHRCCAYGLMLSPDHEWAKEFRANVAQAKPATMGVRVRSQWLTVPDFRLQIKGPGYAWEGSTGRDELGVQLQLPPGAYSVAVEKSNFKLPARANKVASILPGACTTWDIEAEPVSSISGSIRNVHGGGATTASPGTGYFIEGEPYTSAWDSPFEMVGRYWHQLTGLGTPPWRRKRLSYSVQPDAAGRFQIHVLPGSYRLKAVDHDRHNHLFPPPDYALYYPGALTWQQATEIRVPDGGSVQNIHFELPDPGPARRLEVVLVHADGSPAPNRHISYTATRTGQLREQRTDRMGRAAFEVWQTLDYQLHVQDGANSQHLPIPAGSEPVKKRIVVHP
jgi:hypothetical protein